MEMCYNMSVFNNINDKINALFNLDDNNWVIRENISTLNIDKCNGVAIADKETHTCELCVALNSTVFCNNNKPKLLHTNCKFKYIPITINEPIIDFPLLK